LGGKASKQWSRGAHGGGSTFQDQQQQQITAKSSSPVRGNTTGGGASHNSRESSSQASSREPSESRMYQSEVYSQFSSTKLIELSLNRNINSLIFNNFIDF
jgi:hypothetical protein